MARSMSIARPLALAVLALARALAARSGGEFVHAVRASQVGRESHCRIAAPAAN